MAHIKDIVGYEKEVEKLYNVCDFLKNSKKYTDFGVELPNCLLICGQRGVGKTLMAEALTADCERKVFTVNARGCDVANVKSIFKRARKLAPSVVLIDDIDYLDPEADADVLGRIDMEIDCGNNDDVFVVVTADAKENLPKYLLDEFDYDMVIELEPPRLKDACQIFKPIFDRYKMAQDFNEMDFCCFAIDRTYTYVEEIVNKAARLAVCEGAERVSMKHLIKAGLLQKGYEPAVKFDVATAYHEVGHAVVNLLLGGDAACIVLYGNCGGYFEEKKWKSDTYLEKERRYVVRVAGKACEEMFTQSSSIGSENDLKRAREDIEKDIKLLASQGFEYFDSTELNSPLYNDALAKKVQSDLQKYYDRAKELIVQNKSLVDTFVERLRDKFFLLHSEIYDIYNKYMGSKK